MSANATTALPPPMTTLMKTRLRAWLTRFALAGALLGATVWGWAGYQGAHAQVAVAGLWSLCAGTR